MGRDEIICDTLGWCDDHYDDYLWWGIHKRQGTTDIWEYIDGTLAYDSEIIWWDSNQKSESGQDCGYVLVYPGSSSHKKAGSWSCDDSISNSYAFCEFQE